MAIRGVILDIDGTLIDSNDAHAESWVRVFQEFGFKASFEQVRRLIGKGGDKLMPEVTGGVSDESPKGKEMKARRSKLFLEEYLPKIQAFPQARALVGHMKKAGMKVVVGTSASKDESGKLIQIAGIEDLIAEATNADDAERSKPDPDIVKAALGELGMKPEEVIMLGDTPYDLEAATRAGVGLVGVRCGGWKDEDMRGALAIYDDPADVLAHFETSPFVRGGGQGKEAGGRPAR